MYRLTILEVFSAAHQLPASGGLCERLHGHNWKVEVQVRSEALNEQGMVVDFKDLKAITREVLKELDHRFLNELPAFQKNPPTAENLAQYIYRRIAESLPSEDVILNRITIWESETTSAAYEKT